MLHLYVHWWPYRPQKYFSSTLPIMLNKDLALIKHPIRLCSSKGLTEITDLTKDRKRLRGQASQIEKAAEVSSTKNWSPTRQ